MRVTDKELDRLLEKTENHTFNKKFEFRGAPSKRAKSGVIRRITVISAALLTASVAVAMFVSVLSKNTPMIPDETKKQLTDGLTNSETVTDDKSISVDSNTGNNTGDSDITDKPKKAYFEIKYGIPEKNSNIALTKEYGSINWLNWDVMKDYSLYSEYNGDPDNSDKVYYGVKRENGVYSFDIVLEMDDNIKRIFETEKILYIETDGSSDVISGNAVRFFVDYDDLTSSGRYSISFPVSLALKGNSKYTMAKCYIISPETMDENEIKEYISVGNRLENHPDIQGAAGEFCFVEIHDYGFAENSDNGFYDIRLLYERASVYFGDVDENGVPLFISNQELPDYQHPHAKIDRNRVGENFAYSVSDINTHPMSTGYYSSYINIPIS